MEKGANLCKDKKDATLTLHLKADSGYSSYVKYRVSPDQWAEILKILEGKAMAKVIITIEDTEEGLFEIGIEGLTRDQKPSPAMLVGHAVTSMLRKRQKSIHEQFVGQILDACQD